MTDQPAPDTPPPLPPPPPSAPRRRPRISPTTGKLVCLALLGLAAMLPNTMVTSLVDERQANEQEAQNAVAKSWGPAQIVTAPSLMLVTKLPSAMEGHPSITYLRIKPATLDVETEIVPERRQRGFFETTVYTATLHMKGTFAVPDSIPAADGTPLLPPKSGFVTMSLTDAGGVAGDDKAAIDGSAAPWHAYAEPNPSQCKAQDNVLAVPASLTRTNGIIAFDATLHLRGTGRLQIAGLAKMATVAIKSSWPSPSFNGDALPASTSVASDGFLAKWRVDGVDEAERSSSFCVGDAAAGTTIGVDLKEPMPIYRMVVRAAKYAPLFIVLGLTAYFVFEMSAGIAITVLQYTLMSASLSLFALLLVSLGELIGYTSAYVASAGLVIAQASIYTASVTRRLRPGLGFAALFGGLFAFLYVLLGLEALALVTGAIALFLLLTIVMVVTQKVYRRNAQPAPSDA